MHSFCWADINVVTPKAEMTQPSYTVESRSLYYTVCRELVIPGEILEKHKNIVSLQILSETPLSPSRQRPRLDESLSPSAFLEADDSRRHVSCGTYESSVSHMVRRECDESLRNPTPVMLEIIDKQKMRRRRGNSTPLRSGGGSAKKGKNGNRNM